MIKNIFLLKNRLFCNCISIFMGRQISFISENKLKIILLNIITVNKIQTWLKSVRVTFVLS